MTTTMVFWLLLLLPLTAIVAFVVEILVSLWTATVTFVVALLVCLLTAVVEFVVEFVEDSCCGCSSMLSSS